MDPVLAGRPPREAAVTPPSAGAGTPGWPPGDRHAPGGPPGVVGDELQPALFLLLAGFFALLLSLAGPAPDRARIVLESLGAAFGVAASPRDRDAVLTAVDAPEGPDRRARLPLGEPISAAERSAGLLGRVRIDADRLFEADGGVRRWHWFLLHRLAGRADGKPGSGRLEILVPDAAMREAPEATRIRLERLVSRLVASGASRERLSVGILPGRRAEWTFLLREHPEGPGP